MTGDKVTLSDKEAVCLDIMQTDDMLCVGDWAPFIEALVAQGYAKHVTGQWYGITPEGREAFAAFENREMAGMIAEHNAQVRERQSPTIDGEATECPP